MIRGIYTSATAMNGGQAAMDVIANNLANANTIGYKADGVIFDSYLNRAVAENNGNHSAPIGTIGGGSFPFQAYIDLSPGPLQKTGNNLDTVIDGEGFFVAKTKFGDRYTRDGAFQVDTKGILTAVDGSPILGQKGTPIQVGKANVEISSDGSVVADGVTIDKLMVVQVQSAEKTGDARFVGTSVPQKNYNLKIGALEGANVSVVQTMVKMIEVMRSYEANQKALTSQDESLSRAINDLPKM